MRRLSEHRLRGRGGTAGVEMRETVFGSNREPSSRSGPWGHYRRPSSRSRAGGLAVLAVMGLLAVGCGAASKPTAVQLNPKAVAGATSAAVAQYLQISPAPGAASASTADGITVDARPGAKITNVTVKTGGDAVIGKPERAGTSWHSTWALDTGESYTVTATGTDAAGQPVTATSSFHTMTPTKTFGTEIFEGADATYGVGMPIELTFNEPITNKAAVERALQVTTSKPVIGAWYWDGTEAVDFRPRDYWLATRRSPSPRT